MSRLPLRLVALAFVAMLSGCDAAVEPHAAQHDGRTLFQGILFGAGPASDVLPELWGAERPRRGVEAVAVEAYVLDALGRTPGFYARFHAALTSGDPRAVAAMLDRSGALAADALRGYPDPAVARAFAYGSIGLEAGAARDSGTALWTYVHAYRTLLATGHGALPPDALADRPTLEREQVASRLAARLGPPRTAAL